MSTDAWTTMADLLSRDTPLCAATVLPPGNDALPGGAKCVFTTEGVAGGEPALAVLPGLAERAARCLERRTSEIADLGGLRVFVDAVAPEARLLILGAGHIALPLSRFALELGFSVTVLDDRPDYAASARFPGCEVVADDFAPGIDRFAPGPEDFCVVITRGHEHDADCLRRLLPRAPRYLGMIGSRRRVRFVREALSREGFSPESLSRVFAPIGLPLGAESPAEIALSICAELVLVRRLGVEAALASPLRRREEPA